MMEPLKVTGVAQTVRILKDIDKEIVNAARKDLRTTAKPVADAVRANIPREAPLSGMIHNGRTKWQPSGVKVNVKTSFTKRTQENETYLVAIVAGAPKDYAQGAASFQIADIAGRKNSSGRSDTIKPYAYKGGTRTHRKNGQGRAMIQKLNQKGRASRYVYPAAEAQIPFIMSRVKDTIDGLSKSLNEELQKMRRIT